MYCSNCGAQIVGSGRFCSGCGKTVYGTVPPVDAYSVPEPREKSWSEEFREGWRKFVTSPLVLSMIICFSVVQLLNIFEMDSVADKLSILTVSGLYGMEEVLAEAFSAIEALGYFMLVPGILTVIGMWMIYADGTNNPRQPIKTAGLTIIQTIYVLNIVGMTLLLLFILGSISSAEQKVGSYLNDTVEAILVTTKMTLFFAVGIFDILMGVVVCMLSKMRATASDCEPQGAGWAMGIGVLSIISGVLSAISLLSTGITLAGIAGCGYSLLLGAVLCKYKSVMDVLECRYKYGRTGGGNSAAVWVRTGSHSPNVAPAQNDACIPTWKRIQMAEKEAQISNEENNQPAPVQQVLASIEKKSRECDTTQSGDNSVCGADH